MDDFYHSFGPACCGCGGECSGMGRCETCNGALCFFCAEAKGSKRYCPKHAPEGTTDVVTDVLQRTPMETKDTPL